MHELLLQIPKLMAGLTLMLNRNWNTTVQLQEHVYRACNFWDLQQYPL